MKTRLAQTVVLLLAMVFAGSNAHAETERFYIGTYNSNTNRGIYESSLDPATGTFGAVDPVGGALDPSFLALTPDHRFLYAVNEGPGKVSAFSVDPGTHHLTYLNSQSSQGAAPCHVAVDRSGRNVIVANYNGGSITMYPVLTNGMLGDASAHFQDPGKKPHGHCIAIDANNHFVYVCDLGLDQVRCYVLDAQAGTLTTNSAAFITSLRAGAGPRHMTFDPQYKRAYVICELGCEITGFNYDATSGALTQFQTISTLPDGYTNKNTCAEIVVHPSGKFLYGSNRGHNSIAVFKINPDDGTLTRIQEQAVGVMPRNFAIDASGKWCIVANQGSNNILLYSIDQETGMLTPTSQSLSVSKPVCILPY